MKIEKNGRTSCGEKSRHIHIRYFFIKDILKRENIELIHCPTERMIADFYTKPLTGSLFRKLRDIVMGHAPFPVEERVGESIITTDNLGQNKTSKVRKNVTYADVVKDLVTGKNVSDNQLERMSNVDTH